MTFRRPKTGRHAGNVLLSSRHLPVLRGVAFAILAIAIAFGASANPHGMTVSSGAATAATSGSQLTVTTSQAAFLNWQSFNIGAGETTTFVMPSASSLVVNQINGISPSQIWGNLNANGMVVLMNSSGFYFGPHSEIKVGGFVATTAKPPPNFGIGSQWEFSGPPPAASIVNYGKISVQPGGSLYLIAADIENHGTLSAPGGSIGLLADKQVLLSDRPDGLGLNVQVKLPAGSVNNDGQIIADGGSILANAQTVNQNGLVQANSVREKNGVIELVADDAVNLGANSIIEANGGDSGVSHGGKIAIKSGDTFSDSAGSLVSATGGAQGGNGGAIDLSAVNIKSLNSTLTATAQRGYLDGKLFFDPYDILLDTTGGPSPSGGTVLSTTGSTKAGTVLDLNVNTAFAGFSQITLQAIHNITLASGTGWSLSDSTGQTSGKLTLQAGNNIYLQDGSYIYDANSWSVALMAGVNFKTGAVTAGTGNIYLNGGSALTGGGSIQTTAGSISLTAGHDIQMDSGSLQDINFNNIALASDAGSISLSAGHVIQAGPGFIETTGGGAINLNAMQDINTASGFVMATDGGSIAATASTGSLNIGSEFFQTDKGSISLTAGKNIQVGTGAVTTIAGGSIAAMAITGNVNTGTDANGYLFSGPAPNGKQPGGASVDLASLGGISTGAGGDVTIIAGQNVTSLLPASGKPATNPGGDPGSGAFGPEHGDVTVFAGGNVIGHYVVGNGNGLIEAGADALGNMIPGANASAGTSTQLALSLIDGSWTVKAAQNIDLQEVRNPNGIFNNKGGTATPSYHQFNYGADDSVTLDAGNLVDLIGGGARNAGDTIPAIYPPSLTINAAAGGIKLDSEIILFPSKDGSMQFNTSGSLIGLSAANPNLIMSDGGGKNGLLDGPNGDQYLSSSSFGLGDHASTPVHLHNPTTCELNISGDMDNIYLVTPEAAQVTVGGSMNYCSFRGQNLHAGDVTSIDVTGNIFNLNNYTSVKLNLGYTPDFSLLNLAVPTSYSDLFNRLTYNAGTLTVQGPLTQDEVNVLFSLKIPVIGSDGLPETTGQNIPVTQTVHILNPNNAAVVAALKNLETQSAGVPTVPGAGYELGGPGTFKINAHNMDLGATLGIQSVGPLLNNSLAAYCYNPHDPFDSGASVNVTLTGNLDMFSTTICSLAGGNVSVTADSGYINVGSSFTPNDTYPRGIFTAGEGDVTVTANENIDVNGSRIAAYDGGNISVESLTGSVNAGSGVSGLCTVEQAAIVPEWNPSTGKIQYVVETYAPTIPGSGILATTFPPPLGVQFPNEPVPVGNITVKTPRGDIIASAGGIVQLGLNNVPSDNGTVTLIAGTPNLAGGAPLYTGSIDASGSGVIGNNVDLQATGGVIGTVVAQQNLNVNAGQSVNVVAIAGGNVAISAGGSVSGTIIGVGGISASGSSIDASLLSQNVSASGAVSGQVGFGAVNVAGATSQAAGSDDQSKNAIATTDTSLLDDQKNKKRPTLNKTGRVTVVLPDKT
jgi:filamentous hemagglutinin family protein